jgi:hypothetical protein
LHTVAVPVVALVLVAPLATEVVSENVAALLE